MRICVIGLSIMMPTDTKVARCKRIAKHYLNYLRKYPSRGLFKRNGSLLLGVTLFAFAVYALLWKPQRQLSGSRRQNRVFSQGGVTNHNKSSGTAAVLDKIITKAPSISEWLQKRKDALTSSSPRKVLLFCYMRGGSTFFSEIFQHNPEAMFWYEPFDGFYTATYGLHKWHFPMHTFYNDTPSSEGALVVRKYPEWEKAMASDLHHNLMNCNHSGLPVDLLAHTGSLEKSVSLTEYQECKKQHDLLGAPCGYGKSFFSHGVKPCGSSVSAANKQHCAQKLALAKVHYNDPTSALFHDPQMANNKSYSEEQMEVFYNFTKCQNNIRVKLQENCISGLDKKCQNSKLIASKALRITMDSVQTILEKDPDTHVIYLVRDPRAITLSTKDASLLSVYAGSRHNLALEAKYLCTKMKHDLKLYEIYQKLYPGAIKMLKYEDFSREPDRFSREIYEYIGVNIHQSVPLWIKESQSYNATGGAFSTNRSDWTASIEKWRSKVSTSLAAEMSSNCKDVLELLSYKMT